MVIVNSTWELVRQLADKAGGEYVVKPFDCFKTKAKLLSSFTIEELSRPMKWQLVVSMHYHGNITSTILALSDFREELIVFAELQGIELTNNFSV